METGESCGDCTCAAGPTATATHASMNNDAFWHCLSSFMRGNMSRLEIQTVRSFARWAVIEAKLDGALIATRVCMWHAVGTLALTSTATATSPSVAATVGNHLTTQPLSYLFIYVLRNALRGFCCQHSTPSFSERCCLSPAAAAAAVLIKLKWCCKIYFISHSRLNLNLCMNLLWEHLLYARHAYKLSKQITWHTAKIEMWLLWHVCVCEWVGGRVQQLVQFGLTAQLSYLFYSQLSVD